MNDYLKHSIYWLVLTVMIIILWSMYGCSAVSGTCKHGSYAVASMYQDIYRSDKVQICIGFDYSGILHTQARRWENEWIWLENPRILAIDSSANLQSIYRVFTIEEYRQFYHLP